MPAGRLAGKIVCLLDFKHLLSKCPTELHLYSSDYEPACSVKAFPVHEECVQNENDARRLHSKLADGKNVLSISNWANQQAGFAQAMCHFVRIVVVTPCWLGVFIFFLFVCFWKLSSVFIFFGLTAPIRFCQEVKQEVAVATLTGPDVLIVLTSGGAD